MEGDIGVIKDMADRRGVEREKKRTKNRALRSTSSDVVVEEEED